MNAVSMNQLVMHNLPSVTRFFRTNFDIKPSSRAEKLSVNCPYCSTPDTKYHMVINLDWGVVKCFRCGMTAPITAFLRRDRKLYSYYRLLSELSNVPFHDIQILSRRSNIEYQKEHTDEKDQSDEFIKDRGLIPIERMRNAYNYALSRTQNKLEVSTYYADERYIYIPVYMNDKVVAFIARCYIDASRYARYMFHKIVNVTPIAFLDDVKDNNHISNIYVTEGYFDALAVNSCYNTSCAIAIFGKSDVQESINTLKKNIDQDKQLTLLLDSPRKDPLVGQAIDRLYSKLAGNFDAINICLLPEGDPSSIFESKGSAALSSAISNNTLSYAQYLGVKATHRRLFQINMRHDTIPITRKR